MITTDQVKELRGKTGVSIMQCKKALEEADGDMEKAEILLRKKSKEVAAKKASRDLGAGVVASYIHGNGSIGSLVPDRLPSGCGHTDVSMRATSAFPATKHRRHVR